MNLRPEVVEGIAAAKWSLGAGTEDEPYLLALVELGVRLERRRIQALAEKLSDLGGDIALWAIDEAIEAQSAADILQAQPGAEGT